MFRRTKTLCAQCRGTVMVEAAGVSFALFLLILGVFEASLLSYRQLTLYYVTVSAARWGTLGHTTVDSLGQQLNRPDSVKQVLINQAQALGVTVKHSDIKVCRLADGTTCATESTGNRGEVFLVNTGVPLPPFLAFSRLTLTAQAIGKNEP